MDSHLCLCQKRTLHKLARNLAKHDVATGYGSSCCGGGFMIAARCAGWRSVARRLGVSATAREFISEVLDLTNP